MVLRFRSCKVDLPLGRLLDQSLDASMRLDLGGATGTYRVDLSEIVDGEVAGGMSFTTGRP